MWTKGIKRRMEKNRNEFLGIIFRRYPPFILSNHVHNLIDIPAFVFHDVTAQSLEPMLQFLAENGYETLTADEYVEKHVEGEQGRDRDVMLTFDDGVKSLHTVAYPLLKRYGLKAVAYIVPGMVPEGNGSRVQDAWDKHLCTWPQIREMHESGVIDFQSHSMYHHSISISDRVLDFVRPGMSCSFLSSDLAPLCEEAGSASPAYGTPIHNWWSRFGERPAFHECRSAVEACVEYVKRCGGGSYFKESGWRRRLRAILCEARRSDLGPVFESAAEQRRSILKDFQDSKHEIQRHLPGKTVRHFAYPWFRGSHLAVELSAEAGYASNAWSNPLPTFARQDHILIHCPRIPPWYLWRLPGNGRKSLTEALKKRTSLSGRRTPH